MKIVLRDIVSKNGKNRYKLELYGHYLDYRDEIKIIVGRIETETQDFMALNTKVDKMIQENLEPDNEFIGILRHLDMLRLDIKSFFIFTRIFLDTLARIVRLRFDKRSSELPDSMVDLLENKTLVELDPEFAKGLKNRMFWMDTFVERRVEFEHYLGSINSTTTKDGKLGFDILGSKILSGTHRVESIASYIESVLSNLADSISYISNWFCSRQGLH